MQEQVTRMNNWAAVQGHGDADEALRQYERLTEMSQEIVACARQAGNGPEAERMVQTAVQSQSETLAQIRNQLQVENSTPSEVPVQSTVQEQERYGLQSEVVDQATPPTSGGGKSEAGYGQSVSGTTSGRGR
jgi:hypothetical protein